MATNLRTGRPYTAQELQKIQGGQLDTESGYGDRASEDYLNQAEHFDPQGAVNQYAQGAWGSISEGLGSTLDRLRDNSVGAGRFDTGLFDKDQGEVVKAGVRDFNNQIAQTSVSAAGLQLQNQNGIADFANTRTGNALDLTASMRETQENDEREAAAQKRARRGGIGSAIGGVLGAGAAIATGNPWLAGAGWKAGSALGDAAAGY